MATSKQLNIADDSGDIFSKYIFEHKGFKELIIEFDRIHYDYQQGRYTIIEHICIESENKPKSFQDLTEEQKEKICNLIDFKKFIEEQSGNEINLYIDFYFPKESTYGCDILFFPENKIDFTIEFIETDLSNYAKWFQIENFYGEEKNKNKNFMPPLLESNFLNSQRVDNSAFGLSKSCLNNNETYGFNLDKIIFIKKEKKAFIFEFLLCDEAQSVSPHTSHPNKYFKQNSKKFINLYNFSNGILKSPLYLINYAKENTKHADKVKWMRMDGLDVNNNKEPVKTTEFKTSPYILKMKLEQKFLQRLKPQLKQRVK